MQDPWEAITERKHGYSVGGKFKAKITHVSPMEPDKNTRRFTIDVSTDETPKKVILFKVLF